MNRIELSLLINAAERLLHDINTFSTRAPERARNVLVASRDACQLMVRLLRAGADEIE